jgi:sugar/nucleoside kinase (ribokinase family)
MSIIVLGTVALDTVKTPSGKRRRMLGGSAVHFSMSARLFAPVNLVANIGRDFPPQHIEFLKRKGLVLTSLLRCPGKTFHWEGVYEGDLNTARTVNTELGVLADFRPDVSAEQKKIKHIFLANVDPDIQRELLERMYAPALVGLDSMNFWISQKRSSLVRLMKKVHIYVANDQEARSLSGETNLIKAAQRLLSFGPSMILIKKGEHGVLFYSKRIMFSLPAYPVEKVIDPTGAGDTFAGGFMGYLARAPKITTRAIQKAIAYGTAAASFNVEAFGVERSSKFTIRDLDKRISRLRRLVLF